MASSSNPSPSGNDSSWDENINRLLEDESFVRLLEQHNVSSTQQSSYHEISRLLEDPSFIRLLEPRQDISNTTQLSPTYPSPQNMTIASSTELTPLTSDQTNVLNTAYIATSSTEPTPTISDQTNLLNIAFMENPSLSNENLINEDEIIDLRTPPRLNTRPTTATTTSTIKNDIIILRTPPTPRR